MNIDRFEVGAVDFWYQTWWLAMPSRRFPVPLCNRVRTITAYVGPVPMVLLMSQVVRANRHEHLHVGLAS